MSADRRPGGLTALAVLNFIWGGFLAIATLIGALAGAGAHHIATTDAPVTVTTTDESGQVKTETINTAEGKREMKAASNVAWVWTAILGVMTALLIASGVGYLGQKRFLGRTLGNVYAVLSLAGSAWSISQTGLDIMTMVMMIYPLLTVLLINTTFKPDLVN